MRFRVYLILALTGLSVTAGLAGAESEKFVGSFAEPQDGGNLDTALSSYEGDKVTIIPRAEANEAIGGAIRWRNVLFAIRGMKGKSPVFELPLISPGSGRRSLAVDEQSWANIGLVWSYESDASKWNSFGMHDRLGSGPDTWRIQAKNVQPFEHDIVYVSINERLPVAQFYEWLETKVFVHPLVQPTPSQVKPGTFIIGYQSGAEASPACSRAIPDMPLFGFVIKDPSAKPTRLVMLFSGQHPYEGQNKVALEAAVDWILNSTTAEAKAYRARYLTVVYPFVNPTGELAGLWRGTAAQPGKDTNRNWNTQENIPAHSPGIDTVIVHKNALKIDIAALGMGEPYAVFDYHQNFGDRPSEPDYVLHATASSSAESPLARRDAAQIFSPYFARLSAATAVADIASDLSTQETLRGYMVARGVALPLTFERSVYHTLANERAFGVSTVKALVDAASIAGLPVGVTSSIAFNAAAEP